MNAERAALQAQSVRRWERQRQMTADAYAAVLTHLNAAYAAVPVGDESKAKMRDEIAYLAFHARGSLRRVLDEPNPYVNSGERA